MYRTCLPFAVALALGLLGCRTCDVVPSDAPSLPAEEDCGTPGPSGYRVLLRTQRLSMQSGLVESVLLSKDNVNHGSGSNPLLTSLSQQGNVLSLRYCGVLLTGMTNDIGPARNITSVQNLPPQVYQLRITVRNRHTTGTLDLTTVPSRISIADTTVAGLWR